jgi:hypothetical protein
MRPREIKMDNEIGWRRHDKKRPLSPKGMHGRKEDMTKRSTPMHFIYRV